MENGKEYLYNAYNATSTDDGNGEIETYENWLERQLLYRITVIEEKEKEVKRLEDLLKTQNEVQIDILADKALKNNENNKLKERVKELEARVDYLENSTQPLDPID